MGFKGKKEIRVFYKEGYELLLVSWSRCALTVSNNDDATAASVGPPVLMFARTGAPNPIEESWRLKWM